eukprot:gnl/TRDRNA2_/TRDRNA2_177839_c11_seq1.p1 gnl/TRDRNA2_/TRDRNA2_177839_c11~~gnl/TRDRNA2_/TRDRNA2_177839_c11_seq1.p1  ORF type:complete len:101 (+),score=37.25 gnl/TRDRNA2_/TRDRNA2_177839_c11_seq1:38-304(+)
MLADAESTLTANKEGLTAKKNEAMANAQYIMTLHGECDWLIANFDARKEARAEEVEGMQKAKAVLSGADYSLVQMHNSRTLRRKIKHA